MRDARLANFGAFFLYDNFVALNQVFPFGDETAERTRRHENGDEQANEKNMVLFAEHWEGIFGAKLRIFPLHHFGNGEIASADEDDVTKMGVVDR